MEKVAFGSVVIGKYCLHLEICNYSVERLLYSCIEKLLNLNIFLRNIHFALRHN